MRTLLVLLTAALLALACGDTTASPPEASPTTPTARSGASPVVLSGVGKAGTPALSSDAGRVHLEAGSYIVSWQSPDKKFFAFCGLSSAVDYGVTIGLSPEPTTSKLVEELVGGDYDCVVSAKAGSHWKITFMQAA